MPLRKHQRELLQLLRQIESRQIERPRAIGLHVCPGGGKQAAAAMFSEFVLNRMKIADRVCWVTPNGSLREQAASSVQPNPKDPVQAELGYSLKFYEAANEPNPSKSGNGYVTTYQALRADTAGIHRKEFSRYRYALIVDECHHAAELRAWAERLGALWERSALTLVMTGTLDRPDKRRVYGLPYRESGRIDAEGIYREAGTVDTNGAPGFPWIRYPHEAALLDRAVIPVHFQHMDGEAVWKQGETRRTAETLGNDRSALFAALQSEYAEGLLAACLDHWRNYKASHPRSKMLVVCANTTQARRMLRFARDRGFPKAAIATYDDDSASVEIRRFKGSEVDLLVTVAMAYEGLDVPSITHLAALTHIRSRPWIEQMIARSWRFDPDAGKYETQRAYIYCPDDVAMREVITAIETKQQVAAFMFANPDTSDDDGEDLAQPGPKPDQDTITPESSWVTAQRASELGGSQVDTKDTEIYLRVIEKLGLPLSVVELKQAVDGLAQERASVEAVGVEHGNGTGAAATYAPRTYNPTPTEELNLSRRHLNNIVRDIARRLCAGDESHFQEKIAGVNAEIKRRFGERAGMTDEVVQQATRFVRSWYGFDD